MWVRSLRGAGAVLPAVTLLLVMLLVAGPATAQTTCPDTTGIQANLNECARRSYRAADDALNAAWSKARDCAEAQDERHRSDGSAGFDSVDGPRPASDLLLDAQRAWLTFRDGHCATENVEMSGGSMWPMTFTGCLERLTRERTAELNGLLRPISYIMPSPRRPRERWT